MEDYMKKLLLFFITIVISISLIGCANGVDKVNEENEVPTSYSINGDTRHFANGVYIQTGMTYDKPQYTLAGTSGLKLIYSYDINKWVLFETIEQEILYYNNAKSNTPPITGWYTADGKPAALKVNLAE